MLLAIVLAIVGCVRMTIGAVAVWTLRHRSARALGRRRTRKGTLPCQQQIRHQHPHPHQLQIRLQRSPRSAADMTSAPPRARKRSPMTMPRAIHRSERHRRKGSDQTRQGSTQLLPCLPPLHLTRPTKNRDRRNRKPPILAMLSAIATPTIVRTPVQVPVRLKMHPRRRSVRR